MGSICRRRGRSGTHWIYDLSELSARFPGGISGFEAPAAGDYHESKKPGDQTHYGDGALVLLESMAEHGGFDPRAFGNRFVDTFGSSHYHDYLDWATQGTLKNYKRFSESNSPGDYDFQQGADDAEPATASRLAGLAVRYRRDPNLPATIESLTRVCQNNRRAIGYMFRAAPWWSFSWTRRTRRLRKRDGEGRPAGAGSQR